MTRHLETELDAATHRADKLPSTSVDWVQNSATVGITIYVWTLPEGDVLNRLVDLLRRAADAMEVSRP